MADLAPSSLAEWWNVGVGAVAALGTVGAVIFSVATSRRALTDAAEARKETATAEARALDATLRQAAAADRISETERELELGRRAYQRRLETEQKASRQAGSVKVHPSWMVAENEDPSEGHLRVRIENSSTSAITDLQVDWLAPVAVSGEVPAEPIRIDNMPGISDYFGGSRSYYFARPAEIPMGSDVHVRLTFTDAYVDRWELDYPSRTLLLLTPRIIDVKRLSGE